MMNLTAHDIPMSLMFQYFLEPVSAARMNELFEDCGDLYKNHYASYILDQRYMAELLTCIKLQLQAKTREIMGMPEIIHQPTIQDPQMMNGDNEDE